MSRVITRLGSRFISVMNISLTTFCFSRPSSRGWECFLSRGHCFNVSPLKYWVFPFRYYRGNWKLNFLSSILLEMKITLFTICINQYFPQIEAISVYCDFRRFLMRNHSILLLYQREKKIRDASVQRFEQNYFRIRITTIKLCSLLQFVQRSEMRINFSNIRI